MRSPDVHGEVSQKKKKKKKKKIHHQIARIQTVGTESRLTNDIKRGEAVPGLKVDERLAIVAPLVELRHKLVHVALKKRLLLLQGGGRKPARQDPTHPSVILAIPHAQQIVLEGLVENRLFSHLGLPGLAVAANVGPSRHRLEGKLIGGDAHNRTVLFVQVEDDVVRLAADDSQRNAPAGKGPESWAGVFAQRVEVELVNRVHDQEPGQQLEHMC